MNPGKYFLYSMQLSWYSAKVRPYLRHRRLPFDERTPTPRQRMASYLLERHFTVHAWVLGQRPSLADFALAGPLCGHLRYDLASSERWMRPRPNLYRWSERMWSGVPEASGPWLADDAVPETLLPILATALCEMTPYLEATAALA